MLLLFLIFFFFFFNDTATTEIYTLSLHDALPICRRIPARAQSLWPRRHGRQRLGMVHRLLRSVSRHAQNESARPATRGQARLRSEEHTSELQSRLHLVCRLLLEKKKKNKNITTQHIAPNNRGKSTESYMHTHDLLAALVRCERKRECLIDECDRHECDVRRRQLA